MSFRQSNVVDLARYRAAREQRRLPFPDVPGPLSLAPTVAMCPQSFTERQTAHRRLMLSHLQQTRECKSFNSAEVAAAHKIQS